MSVVIPLVLIALGVLALSKGADWLVDGASTIARKWGIAPLVIGLTIVAFGTSAPELAVNLLASLNGNPEIAIGNIVGSNIANILLILGIAAVIRPLSVHRNTVWKEIPLALLAVLLLWAMASDSVLAGRTPDLIDRIDSFSLLAFFAVFMYYTMGIAKTEPDQDGSGEAPVGMPWLRVSGGLAALVLGAKLTVDGAISIATAIGISERVIGLTVVAVGTSLPELVTSAVAAKKGETDIAIGNVVGSNIFNVFLILGVSAYIRPLPFSAANASDVLVAVGAALLLFMALFVGKRHTLERWQGWGFIGCYAGYLGWLALS